MMNVVILHDLVSESSSPDQVDVLLQAEAVSNALSELGFEPIPVSVSLDVQEVIKTIRHIKPAFVFNLVECIHGRGHLIHLIPSVLDYLGVHYTGSSSEALFVTSHKPTAKAIMTGAGVPTPAWWDGGLSGNCPKNTEGQYIIKSVWEHASAGLDDDAVVSVSHAEDLFQLIADREKKVGTRCFAESFIAGREFNVSVLASPEGGEVLPVAEILFEDFPPEKQKIVGYRAKWLEESFEYDHTPRTFDYPAADCSLLAELAEIAKRCWNIFDLHGYARVDFRVDSDMRPWVLEVNANPCLAPEGGFLAAAAQRNLTPKDVVERIINDRVQPVTARVLHR